MQTVILLTIMVSILWVVNIILIAYVLDTRCTKTKTPERPIVEFTKEEVQAIREAEKNG